MNLKKKEEKWGNGGRAPNYSRGHSSFMKNVASYSAAVILIKPHHSQPYWLALIQQQLYESRSQQRPSLSGDLRLYHNTQQNIAKNPSHYNPLANLHFRR